MSIESEYLYTHKTVERVCDHKQKKNQGLYWAIVVHRLHANPPVFAPAVLQIVLESASAQDTSITASTEAPTAPPFQLSVLR